MKQAKGLEAFETYFKEVYKDRWAEIHQALLQVDRKVARKNLFFTEPVPEGIPGLGPDFAVLPHCFEITGDFDLSVLTTSLLPFYRMDPASIMPAQALTVEPGDKVLDMCAAPGGKTLVLMEALANAKTKALDTSGHMVANELSAKRRHRMMTVFKRHLPREIRSMIQITGMDGAKFGLHKKGEFDRILLDAPCSGERGLLQKKSELANWKVKRTKSFGIRQYSLLSSAFLSLKPGGTIVYSTCSISPMENDEVVAKLIKRRGDEVEVEQTFEAPQADVTEFGYQFLPDRDGWGPIYFSKIKKKSIL